MVETLSPSQCPFLHLGSHRAGKIIKKEEKKHKNAIFFASYNNNVLQKTRKKQSKKRNKKANIFFAYNNNFTFDKIASFSPPLGDPSISAAAMRSKPSSESWSHDLRPIPSFDRLLTRLDRRPRDLEIGNKTNLKSGPHHHSDSLQQNSVKNITQCSVYYVYYNYYICINYTVNSIHCIIIILSHKTIIFAKGF